MNILWIPSIIFILKLEHIQLEPHAVMLIVLHGVGYYLRNIMLVVLHIRVIVRPQELEVKPLNGVGSTS